MDEPLPTPTPDLAAGEPPTTGAGDAAAAPAYVDAIAELESILAELEGSEVDVDRLADRVARAAELVAVCRERITNARARIDEVLVDLDEASSPELGEATDRPRA